MICTHCGIETGTPLNRHPFERPTAGSCEVAKLEAEIAEKREALEFIEAFFDRLEGGTDDSDPLSQMRRKYHKPVREALAKGLRIEKQGAKR